MQYPSDGVLFLFSRLEVGVGVGRKVVDQIYPWRSIHSRRALSFAVCEILRYKDRFQDLLCTRIFSYLEMASSSWSVTPFPFRFGPPSTLSRLRSVSARPNMKISRQGVAFSHYTVESFSTPIPQWIFIAPTNENCGLTPCYLLYLLYLYDRFGIGPGSWIVGHTIRNKLRQGRILINIG